MEESEDVRGGRPRLKLEGRRMEYFDEENEGKYLKKMIKESVNHSSSRSNSNNNGGVD